MFGKKKKDPATFETNVSTKTILSESSATTISTKNTATVSGKNQYTGPEVDTIPEPVNAVEEEMENNTVEEMRENEIEDTERESVDKTETVGTMDEPAFTKSKSIKSTRTASVVQVEDVASKSASVEGISSNIEEQESDVVEDEEEKCDSVSDSVDVGTQSMESDAPSPSLSVRRVSTLVAGIKLPLGAKSGELIDIEHDGKRKTITVPKGFKGGDEYTVKLTSKKVDEEEVATGMFCGCA